MKNILKNLTAVAFLTFTGVFSLSAQTGNVGIGTTNPNANAILDLTSTNQGLLMPRLNQSQEDALTAPVGLVFYNTSTRTFRYQDGFGLRNIGYWRQNIYAGGEEEIVYEGGQVTIGNPFTSNALRLNQGRLFINTNYDASSTGGTINIANGLFMDNNEIVTTGEFFINADNSGSSAGVNICGNGATTRMNSGGGMVRIGTNPSNFNNYGLQVGYTNSPQVAASFQNNSPNNGGSFATLRLENEGITGHALVVQEGTVLKPGGGSWGAPSDRRLKQNINDYSEGLAQIRAIRPVTFQYNEKSGFSSTITYVGTIAQEVEEVASHMVTHDGEYLGVDPSAFTYMLINAIQEQDQIITDQQKEIDELKARLDRIEALLKK
jgi:hypothetical protein